MRTTQSSVTWLAGLVLGLMLATPAAAVMHPTLGRWMQRDPLGYPDGYNAYAAYHLLQSGADPSGQAKISFSITTPTDMLNFMRNILKSYKQRGTISASLSSATTAKSRQAEFTTVAEITWKIGTAKSADTTAYLSENACQNVAFIQIARTDVTPRKLRDPANTWHIDSKDDPIFYENQSPGRFIATLEDQPGSGPGRTAFEQQFETCAICIEGCEVGLIYGCIEWGHYAIERGKWFLHRWVEGQEKAAVYSTAFSVTHTQQGDAPSNTFLEQLGNIGTE